MTATAPSQETFSFTSLRGLRSITGVLINNFRKSAVERQNILVNNIPDDIYIDTDRNLLAKVVGELLANVITQSSGNLIQVSAKVYSQVVLLHIKVHSANKSLKLNSKLQHMAEKMGGFVGMNKREQFNTIAFSFPNLP